MAQLFLNCPSLNGSKNRPKNRKRPDFQTLILLEQIASMDNVADLFTKPLAHEHHHR